MTPDHASWPEQPVASVRVALHEAVRPALADAPCLVAFSGGRDSSVVLAVAVELARREGLPPPIPVTREHPGVPSLSEEPWQRRVLDHLGLTEWLRLPFTDELDVVGPVAQRALSRHGVIWPAAAHTSLPLFEAASGGTVLTGEGGDEMFIPSRIGRLRVALRDRPRDGRVSRVWSSAELVAPRPIRRRRAAARAASHAPTWLTPKARAQLVDLLAADEASAPLGLRSTLGRLLTRRAWRLGADTLACLAEHAGARVVHPLVDPRVLAALYEASRPWGFPDRTVALHALFADLLPRDVLGRRSKVVFNDALFTDHARRLATAWSGEGVDTALVDPGRLRAEWLVSRPSVLSAPLLQQVWYRQAAT